MSLDRVLSTNEEYVEYLTDYIDRVVIALGHRSITRTSWRVEDIIDVLLDLRNEVTVLGISAEVLHA